MFREMRRKKQLIPENEVLEILAKGTTAVLGVIGDEGYPYTVPINYTYNDGKVYFHCAKTGHKLDAIKACDKVSLCVVAKDEVFSEELNTHFQSIIMFGKARILETDEEIVRAAQIFGLKYNSDKSIIDNEIKKDWDNLCVVEITVEHMTGKESLVFTNARG